MQTAWTGEVALREQRGIAARKRTSSRGIFYLESVGVFCELAETFARGFAPLIFS